MPTTQQKLLKSFIKGCSSDRLDKYRQSGDTDETVIARYLWNIALGEALYPTIQTLEVTLRNSLHDTISAKYNRSDWYDIPQLLEPFGKHDLINAKKNLTDAATKRNLQPTILHTPGRIVAELTFGFWTGLFSSDYEMNRQFWPTLIVPVFPRAPRHARTRRAISRILHPLRYLRNRIFHHEPIWATPHLVQRHADMLKIVRWINPDICDTITLFDRFPTVHTAGHAHCLAELRRIMT